LHPSAPPAAATAVRHASPPRPRKHTAAPFKAPGGGGGGGGKLLFCLASSLFLWLPFFSAGVVNQTLRHRRGNARYPDFKNKSRAAALWLNIKLN